VWLKKRSARNGDYRALLCHQTESTLDKKRGNKRNANAKREIIRGRNLRREINA
jgi:hypothetical protein